MKLADTLIHRKYLVLVTSVATNYQKVMRGGTHWRNSKILPMFDKYSLRNLITLSYEDEMICQDYVLSV